jgi:hypothetical protein
MRERREGAAICCLTTVKRITPLTGRRTVSWTSVPRSPLMSASERANEIVRANLPSMRTMTSPRLIPAARAGPSSAEVTISPSREGPTVSPMPE